MGDGQEDGQVDLEALQAQIELSLGALSDLADACIPTALRGSTSTKHTNATAKSSAGFQTRYPRYAPRPSPRSID